MTITILHSVLTSVTAVLLNDLISGAITGIVIGLAVGALVMPMVQEPDTMIRGILVGFFGAAVMGIYQVYRISQLTGSTMSSIFDAFRGPYQDFLGRQILDGFLYVLGALFVGAIIGAASQVPDKVIKGGIIGLFVGLVVGAALTVILDYTQFRLATWLFRVVMGILIWGVMTSIVAKNT